MDHVVYLDTKEKELAEILKGNKTMIIRGAAGRKMPYGRVSQDDLLYLIENDGSGLVRGRAKVVSVLNSEKMTQQESISLVDQYQGKLQLTASQHKRWAGKRYLVLIEIDEVQALDGFRIDKRDFGNMDDWLPVEDIEKVKLTR